jgi:hypothetical protein
MTITEGGRSTDHIHWEMITRQNIITETDLVKHVRYPSPLQIKCDGPASQGVVLLFPSLVKD